MKCLNINLIDDKKYKVESRPDLTSSPSGAVFGPVLGLMAFFYFFARLTLFCSAWIATAQYPNNTIESDNHQQISNTD